MKASFGEFGAFTVRNGVRFNKVVDGKTLLVSESAIPPEVAVLLRNKLGLVPATPAPTQAPVQVPIQEPVDNTPLTSSDFVTDEPVALQPLVNEKVSEQVFTEPAQLPTPTHHIDADYLESVSIHSASIYDLAQAFYDRFGVYTVWLMRLPENDEVNPFTGMPLTKYEKGLAYQAFIRAESRGTFLEANPETMRKDLDGKRSAVADYQETFVPVAETLKQARDQNSFEWRTSVRGMNAQAEAGVNGAGVRMTNDDFTDEPLVEPKIGGAPIIRPNW